MIYDLEMIWQRVNNFRWNETIQMQKKMFENCEIAVISRPKESNLPPTRLSTAREQ